MNNDTHFFSPADVEKLTGISVTTQRDRRRRGLTYFGKERPNGRWAFSPLDLLGFAISTEALRVVGDLFEAERIGHWCAPYIAGHLKLDGAPFFFRLAPRGVHVSPDVQDLTSPSRYALFAKGQNPIVTNDPSLADTLGVAMVVQIDLKKLAAKLPEELVSVLGSLK